MIYSVIDIGSNSVRRMLHDGERTISKTVKITRLAEGMGQDKLLSEQAVIRTASVVQNFVEQSKTENVDKIYAFGTAALRQALNRDFFLKKVKDACGVDVEIISGEMEAEIGLMGALNRTDGGVIDIGGASAEVIVCKDEKKIYSKSLNIGVVKIKETCGHNKKSAREYIEESIKEYGDIPLAKFYSIGGTATSIASILIGEKEYNPNKVNGFIIAKSQLLELVDKLYSMEISQIKNIQGLQAERAEVISGGALCLLAIMDKIGVNEITVSESDNLEGYLMVKTEIR